MGSEQVRHPGEVLSALADGDRLRVFAALVLHGPATVEEVAGTIGSSIAATGRALRRLAAGGLVDGKQGEAWRAVPEAVGGAARLAARLSVVPDPGADAATPEEAAVLRAYLVGGRLRSIPAVRHKRLVVLDWLSQQFEPGKVYAEAEVNRVLARHHPDHAALRRFLVDEDLMTRRQGFYWRSGGTFDVE
jgi:hypothetical protein